MRDRYDSQQEAATRQDVKGMRSLIALYDALISSGVPREKARAVVDAMARCLATRVAHALSLFPRSNVAMDAGGRTEETP